MDPVPLDRIRTRLNELGEHEVRRLVSQGDLPTHWGTAISEWLRELADRREFRG